MTTEETHVPTFDSTLQTTHRWLLELRLLAGLANDKQAYSVLRAVLHGLRDRLPVAEAAQLGAELPMLVRGFYYEGWKPAAVPTRVRSRDGFLEALEPMPDLGGDLGAEEAARDVFLMLDHRISEGEIDDVRHLLPPDIRGLWPEH